MENAFTIDESLHLALQGAGGLGKTSIAIAFLYLPSTRSRFGENIHGIACDIAEKDTLLLQSLAATFKVQVDAKSQLVPQIVNTV